MQPMIVGIDVVTGNLNRLESSSLHTIFKIYLKLLVGPFAAPIRIRPVTATPGTIFVLTRPFLDTFQGMRALYGGSLFQATGFTSEKIAHPSGYLDVKNT